MRLFANRVAHEQQRQAAQIRGGDRRSGQRPCRRQRDRRRHDRHVAHSRHRPSRLSRRLHGGRQHLRDAAGLGATAVATHITARMTLVWLGLVFAPPIAICQPAVLNASQSDALHAYTDALSRFKAILEQRRAQINAHQPLPNLPGQALYLARVAMMSTYKDLTDALPGNIGRPNKFAIPPAYFDADNEPLIDEYLALFNIMQAPPATAQNSETPFKDVVDLGTVIARAKGVDAANSAIAGRISLGLFFAETNGNQNIGNARSNTYKGSLQTGPAEDRSGQMKWQAIRKTIMALDPKLLARDAKEEARAGNLDHRFNHWTAVRDGLMNGHAELFPRIPDIAKALPNPIDQMKVFELIQIIPGPTKSALASGRLTSYEISDPTVMGYLRNNSILAFGRADRAKTSATFGEILDAMWLFNDKFERALALFNEIVARQKSGGRQP